MAATNEYLPLWKRLFPFAWYMLILGPLACVVVNVALGLLYAPEELSPEAREYLILTTILRSAYRSFVLIAFLTAGIAVVFWIWERFDPPPDTSRTPEPSDDEEALAG